MLVHSTHAVQLDKLRFPHWIPDALKKSGVVCTTPRGRLWGGERAASPDACPGGESSQAPGYCGSAA